MQVQCISLSPCLFTKHKTQKFGYVAARWITTTAAIAAIQSVSTRIRRKFIQRSLDIKWNTVSRNILHFTQENNHFYRKWFIGKYEAVWNYIRGACIFIIVGQECCQQVTVLTPVILVKFRETSLFFQLFQLKMWKARIDRAGVFWYIECHTMYLANNSINHNVFLFYLNNTTGNT